MKFNNSFMMLGSAALLLGVSGMVHAGIANTKHNLSIGAPGTNTVKSSDANSEICVFCHTPHNSNVDAATKGTTSNTLPLWNRSLATGGAAYDLYNSTTMDADMDAAEASLRLGGTVSNLCLSCHDGTVAVASVTNPSNNWTQAEMTAGMQGLDNGAGMMNATDTPNTLIGIDLTNDHPINFDYDAVVTADKNSYGGDNFFAQATATTNGARFFDNTVQCASCHDPHTSENSPFLRASPVESELCLACHNK